MKIRTQLLVMATAVLLPVIAATSWGLEKIREGERQAALRGLRETVRATALIVDREVQGSITGLKVVGHSRHLETGDFAAFYLQAEVMNQLPDVWTLLLDDTGRQVLNTVVPFGTPPPVVVAREHVQKVIRTQAPLVTDVFAGPVTGRMLTTLYAPVSARGGKKFVVAQAFSVDYWKRKALQRDLPADWVVAVIDRQGNFISRSHRSNELLGKPARAELVAAAAQARDGLIRHSTIEGVDSYDAFAHSSLTGWTVAIAAPVATIEAAAERAMRVALAGMVAAMGIAAIAVLVFGRSFIRAIESASRSARLLGHGHRPVLVKTSIDEIGELNRSLQDASHLLQIERQSRQAAETEREQLLANETSAREAAQAQNIAKDEFLAMLGHELRNPLAAIAGATQLLQKKGHDQGLSARCVAIISRQNQHLSHIVNDLLDVSRLMAGKITLDKAPLELAETAMRCIDALRLTERASAHGIAVDASPVWVAADRVRLDQILNNLLTNALKFSPPGAEIRVAVGEQAGRAVVSVTDAGIGMAADLLESVFEPFVQGPAPLNRLQSGLGIGLALVRRLVQLHGGDVSAFSEGANRGSVFSFWLPSVAAQPAADADEAAPFSGQLKLVYVEDNQDARMALGELLRFSGCDVIEIEDGGSTLPAVLAAQPDVVLMDIGLPDISGYEVARRLRAEPLVRGIPLIALTGYGQMSDRMAATAAGFDAHLVKPVDPDVLMRTIDAVVRGARPAKAGADSFSPAAAGGSA